MLFSNTFQLIVVVVGAFNLSEDGNNSIEELNNFGAYFRT